MLTIQERVTACSETLVCWLEVLEQKKLNTLPTDGRLATPNCFPLEDASQAALLLACKSLVCLSAARQCTGLHCVCTASSKTPPCVSSLRLVGISPDVLPCSHFPPGQQSVHSRSHANVECVAGWQLFFSCTPIRFYACKRKIF